MTEQSRCIDTETETETETEAEAETEAELECGGGTVTLFVIGAAVTARTPSPLAQCRVTSLRSETGPIRSHDYLTAARRRIRWILMVGPLLSDNDTLLTN